MDCFKLKGMDSTNSNAEVRGILIHTSCEQYLQIWYISNLFTNT